MKTVVENIDHYGVVLLHVVDNLFIRTPVKSLNDYGVSSFFIIPQRVSQLGNRTFYARDRVLFQSLDVMLKNIDYSKFEKQLLQDTDINKSFVEYKEFMQERKEQQKLEQERIQNQKLYDSWIQNGMSEKVVSILKKIHQNRESWGFDKWNVDDNFIDKNEFMRSRMRLINGNSLKSVIKKKDEIEAVLRTQILLNSVQDKGSFELTILFDSELRPYKIPAEKVRELNARGQIFIGRSLMGDVVTNWNQQANHMLIGGISGSGKSVLLVNLAYQLINLKNEFDYSNVYLTSSSKVADFVPFERKGAKLASGVRQQVEVFKEVKQILEQREKAFAKNSVKNIYEYNQTFPEKRMANIILLADEYENSLLAGNKEFEQIFVEILNIARSSGATILVGSQSVLKKSVGTALDKLTIKFSGFNNKNVLNQLSSDIANYYKTLEQKPQGVFFFNSLNLELEYQLNFGESNYTLIQTPLITELEDTIRPLNTEIDNKAGDENLDVELLL